MAILALAMAMAMGCATILDGHSRSVAITSEPSGAQVYVDGNNAGATPAVISVEAGKSHSIEVRKAGYRSQGRTTVSNAQAGWLILDIALLLALWPVPLIVDAATGDWDSQEPDKLHFALESESGR